MTRQPDGRVHPAIYQAQEQLQQGRISRREFLRVATLLGTSLSTATLLAACGAPPAAEAPPTTEAEPTEEPEATEEEPTEEPEATEEPTEEPGAETAVAADTIIRGGTLTVGMKVQAVDHPARFAWTEPANNFRLVFEYLTQSDEENITHPQLLESWEASDDLTVWTLNLRQGIMWVDKDGEEVEELVADHVVYNFNEWLNPEVGSSILGLWEGFLKPEGVEVVDDHTIRLNLAAPKLDVPENLFHYPAQIVHPTFNGDATSGTNLSTGPYLLEEYIVGERSSLVRRENYWQMGADGEPLPYLDRIEFIDLGDDETAYITALQNGQIHTKYEPSANMIEALRDDANLVIYSVDTSQVRTLRVRVDQEPWDNNDVRLALKKCQDRQKILDIAALGEGLPGHDFHVAPVQPDFAPMEVPEYDPEGAKQLLEQAGFADGLDVSIAIGTGWADVVGYAETLQQDAAPAGFNITLENMPNTAYWDLWTETTVGITPWTHRPLGVMLLPLAYIADAEGKPVPWNETRWVDEEFSELLKEAQGTLDLEARREIMAELERIQMERGPVGIAWWKRVWEIFNPAFQNVQAHPTLYNLWREVWYNPDADPNA